MFAEAKDLCRALLEGLKIAHRNAQPWKLVSLTRVTRFSESSHFRALARELLHFKCIQFKGDQGLATGLRPASTGDTIDVRFKGEMECIHATSNSIQICK